MSLLTNRLLAVCGTAALILGILMVAFGLVEAVGVRVAGDVSPGGSPIARILIGMGLCVFSLLLRRLAGRSK